MPLHTRFRATRLLCSLLITLVVWAVWPWTLSAQSGPPLLAALGSVAGRVAVTANTPLAFATCTYVDLALQPILDGGGQLVETLADAEGQYVLSIWPALPGFVQCSPQNFPLLQLLTFIPALLPGERLTAQDVMPATTVVSRIIQAFYRADSNADLAAVKADRLAALAAADPDLAVLVDAAIALYGRLWRGGINFD